LSSIPRWLAIGLTILAALGMALFAWAELAHDGWADYHRYGRAPDGSSWAQHLSPTEVRYYASLLLLLPALLAAAAWATRSRGMDAVLEVLQRRDRWITGIAAGVAFLAALGVSHLALERTPITDDEEAYLFHARVVASGALTSPSPPDAPFYDNVFLINDGRWFSQYPVGNPLLLAPGVWLGDPWLIPALLAALITLLLAAAARTLFGPIAGPVTAVLCATSPFLAAMSGTLLSHTPCLFALSLGLWCGLRATRNPGSARWAAAAALAWGLAVLIRPSSAVLVATPLAVLLLWRWWSGDRRAAVLVTFAAAGLVMLALQGSINHHCNGHPLRSAYTHYWATLGGWSNPFGFGEFPWGIRHTPGMAAGNAWRALVRLDAWLLGWPISLALPLAAPWLARRHRGATLALLASGGLSFAVYFWFFWPGIADVGPVLYFETSLAWWLLAGAALAGAPPAWRRGLIGVAAAGVLLAPLTFHRVGALALAETAGEAGRARVVTQQALGDGPVLMFCDEYLRPSDQGSWVAGRPNPWPDLHDPVLFVRDHGADQNRAFARRQHPTHALYRLRWEPDGGLVVETLDGARVEENADSRITPWRLSP
jgi:Dolichyl-phosphate-mannose-protein mannosyltransferase